MRKLTCSLSAMLCLQLGSSVAAHAQTYEASVLALLTDFHNLGQEVVIIPTDWATPTNQLATTALPSTLTTDLSNTSLPVAAAKTPPPPPTTYTDSEYKYKLSLLKSKIPLTYNSVVRYYIDQYTKNRRASSQDILGASLVYFPVFEKALLEQDLPTDLKYLAVVESRLINNLFSTAGAGGLWQLMPGTGRNMGLTVNESIDERLDPVRSSEAAAAYLKRLYKKYGDWMLVIAAYNCGDGKVDEAIRRTGGNRNYWAISDHLPRATRTYVPIFIACVYWMNYSFDHYLVPTKSADQHLFTGSDAVTVKGGLSLSTVSTYTGVSMETLKKLNPALKKGYVPTSYTTYPLRLPVTEIYTFKQFEDLVYTTPVMAAAATTIPKVEAVAATKEKPVVKTAYDNAPDGKLTLNYTVKSGDNLGLIASWYQCNSSDIKTWNHLSGSILQPGQKLKIYVRASEVARYEPINKNTTAQNQALAGRQQTAQTVKSGTTAYKSHTIQQGDTLWKLAQRYPANTIQSLRQLNGLKSDVLKPGKVLKVKTGKG